MKEFIEELKYNQNINFEKDLENRIDIDYVIERLEDIQKEQNINFEINKIYDNGAIMLGNVKMVKEEIKREIEKNIDMCFADMEEILKDLEEFSNETIVAINYDSGMGYSIDYWHEDDIVKGCE